VSEETLSAAAGRPVSYDLGDGETATLANDLDPSLFESVCSGLPNLPPPPDCDTGFPVTVMLTVSTPNDPILPDQVMAIRTLRLRFRDGQEANANPSLGELYAEVAGTHETINDDPASNTTLPRNVATDIFATIPDGPPPGAVASETYNGKDDNGQPAVKREHLTLSWFVETGDTRLERTSFLDGFTTLENAGKNKWTPQTRKKYDHDTSKLIVVIRDDRNGVGWSSGTVQLEPTP
jgi:hypothetical protein